MNAKSVFICLASGLLLVGAMAADTSSAPKENVFAARPAGLTFSVKMVGPYMEPADLQII